jgi:hypothetical protein
MRVRLTRKLAERINGVDLTGRGIGDVLDLPEREALLLVNEQWATLENQPDRRAPIRSTERAVRSSTAKPAPRKPEGRRSPL